MERSKRQIIAELNGLCKHPIPLALRIRMLFWKMERLQRVRALATYHVQHYGRKIHN